MRNPMLLATLLTTALAFAGCSANEGEAKDDATAHDGAATVEMVETAYSPKELRVHAGVTVTFRNQDDMGHTVTPDDGAQWGTTGSGDAPDDWLNKDDTWSWTFTKPGTYRYHCLPHATKAGNGYLGMAGTIIVE